MQQQKVLIAVGNKAYSDILTETFQQHPQFLLSSQEVLHRRFLEEILELERPDLLVVHDYYLESDFTRQEKKDEELISFIKKIRVQYDESIRVVFLCERPKGDPFLSTMVSIGVLDIFNTNSFDLGNFIQQLVEKPRFSKVEKFFIAPTSYASPGEVIEEPIREEKIEEPQSEPEAKKEKVVVQKVIEKKVVQKVVNKNVIKRDYNIHVHNQMEKIVGVPIKKKLVMIGSPIPRSGSTFISHSLARALTQMGVSSTYVESPFSMAYTYDRFFGFTHASDYRSRFYQFSKYIDPKLRSVYDWNKSEVNIICKHPTNEPVYSGEDVSFENLIKVLFSSSSTVTIMDVGTDWHYELFQDVFDIADHVYFVMEPDIPFIQYFEESQLESVDFLRKKLEHEKSSIIGNRFDKTLLNNKLIKDLYSDRIKTIFPSFSMADVFQSQYEGVFLNDYKDYKNRIELAVHPLLEEILPREFIKKQKKGSGLFKGLFNKKISVEKSEAKGEDTTV